MYLRANSAWKHRRGRLFLGLARVVSSALEFRWSSWALAPVDDDRFFSCCTTLLKQVDTLLRIGCRKAFAVINSRTVAQCHNKQSQRTVSRRRASAEERRCAS